MFICSRTATTIIRQHADGEHKEKDPNFGKQINLRVLMSACVSLQANECKRHVLTRLHSCHFKVTQYRPETSGTQPFDGDVDG